MTSERSRRKRKEVKHKMANENEPASKEPALVKVTVHKERTINVGKYESAHPYYTIEDPAVPRDKAFEVIKDLRAKLDTLVAEDVATAIAASRATPSAPPTPAPSVQQPVTTPPAKPAPTPVSPSTAAPTPPSSNTDPYANLAWRQSEKKPALSTIRVDETLLADPRAKRLYDLVKPLGKQGVKIGGVNYKLSIAAPSGTEFLQCWRNPPAGGS